MELDRWVDDQWSLRVSHPLPLSRLAAVALLLAAKVLLGRSRPVPLRDQPGFGDDDEDDDPADLLWW